MSKKIYTLAFLALAATAVSSSKVDMKKLRKVKDQLKSKIQKREGECAALTCAKIGGACTDDVECQYPSKCHDGVCRMYSAGDACVYYEGCFNDSLYCDYIYDVCREYNKLGDKCVYSCKGVNDELYCNIPEGSSEGTCKLAPQKIGDSCDGTAGCPSGSYCNIPDEMTTGTCVALPAVVGADCSEIYECDSGKWLYCSDDTLKCVEYPKENEECYNYECNEGLYCDGESNTCKALGDLYDPCESDSDCKGDLRCGQTNNLCSKEYPEEGEYCDNYDIYCSNDFMCLDNVCVKKNGTCSDAEEDCYDPITYYCDEGRCKGHMGISEGGLCTVDVVDGNYIFASMQCAEGLGCVPNDEGDGTCKKITSKIENAPSCANGEDCPEDSVCECNDITGEMKCIPIPVSSKGLVDEFDKFYKKALLCDGKYGNDELKYQQCYAKQQEAFAKYVAENVYPYSAEYRCLDYSLVPSFDSESGSSASGSESGSSAPAPSPSSSGYTPIIIATKYVEIVFKSEGMKKDDVDAIVRKYVPNGAKYDIAIVEDKAGKTYAAVEFDTSKSAKSFVDSIKASSDMSAVEEIKYLDKIPSSFASAIIPSFFVLFGLKLFF